MDNDGERNATVTVSLGATAGIFSPDVTLLNDVSLPVAVDINLFTGSMFTLYPDDGDGPGNINPDLMDGRMFLGGTANDTLSSFINILYFADYSGPGTFDIQVAVDQIINLNVIGNVEINPSPVDAAGSVEVIYTAIPEPATIATLFFGALTILRK